MEQKWTKILTKAELELISDTYYPIIKKNATQKISEQLIELGHKLIQIKTHQAFKIAITFKLSKGENYHDLPYQVLDFPKIANAQFEWLGRIVFWWGKYIGAQLFVNQHVLGKINVAGLQVDFPNSYVLLNNNIWNNDINTADFKLIATLSPTEIKSINELPYLKLVQVYYIKKPDNLFDSIDGFYEKLFESIQLTTQ